MNKDQMTGALRKSIDQCGIDIVNSNKRLRAILCDFLPGANNKFERKFLLDALELDEWHILLETHEKDQAEHTRAINVLLPLLRNHLGWTEERSILVLECYTTAMGWKDVTILQSHSKEQPKLQFETQPQTSTTATVLYDETRELLEFVKLLKNNSGGQLLPQQSDTPSLPVVAASKKSITVATAIGSNYKFGAYDWRVIDVQGDRALLISQDIIAIKEYNETCTDVIWETCTLRKWLNEDFLHIFREEDQSRIVITTNSNKDNQWFGTNGGRRTQDRIFLLSISEAVRYFGDSGQLKNKNPESKYRIHDQFNSERIAKFNNSSSWWWLRSPGVLRSIAVVDVDGGICVDGVTNDIDNDGNLRIDIANVDNGEGGVRPALWLNL
jgi:hypothetical protein